MQDGRPAHNLCFLPIHWKDFSLPARSDTGSCSAAALFCQYCYTSERASELLTNKIYYLSYSEFIFTARNSDALSCPAQGSSGQSVSVNWEGIPRHRSCTSDGLLACSLQWPPSGSQLTPVKEAQTAASHLQTHSPAWRCHVAVLLPEGGSEQTTPKACYSAHYGSVGIKNAQGRVVQGWLIFWKHLVGPSSCGVVALTEWQQL